MSSPGSRAFVVGVSPIITRDRGGDWFAHLRNDLMDERLRAFLWILSSAGTGGALGAAFGAIAGALYWRSGGSSGTWLAHWVVDKLARFGEREFAPTTKGALVG